MNNANLTSIVKNLDFKVITSDDSGKLNLELNLSESSGLYEGHFPDFPILPGLLQVHIALKIFQNVSGQKFEFKGFKNIKFINPILPTSKINLEITPIPALKALDIHYFNDKFSFCKGRAIIEMCASEHDETSGGTL